MEVLEILECKVKRVEVDFFKKEIKGEVFAFTSHGQIVHLQTGLLWGRTQQKTFRSAKKAYKEFLAGYTPESEARLRKLKSLFGRKGYLNGQKENV